MENAKLFSVSIPELLDRYGTGQGMENDLFVTSEIKEYIDMFSFPLRVDALLFFVCVKGSINITANLVDWEITENSYAIGFSETVIGLNRVSDDFEGFIVLLSMDYLKRINIDLKEVWPYYVYIRNYPCVKMNPRKVEEIGQFYTLLYDSLGRSDTHWKGNIINGLVASMIFKVCEDLDELELGKIATKAKSKQDYYIKFMGLLLEGFREHHSVSYYADRLALSPKYLSTLMKEVSGLSAAQWIDQYLITEAKTLLKFSDMTIQQIADYLYFANQSFFSKFFRQHTEMTPSDYRSGKSSEPA